MTLDREPALAAARQQISEWQIRTLEQSVIWRVVNAALDAIEESLVAGRDILTGQVWVISYHSTPVLVCRTRYRARRKVRQLMELSGEKRNNYTIRAVETETP